MQQPDCWQVTLNFRFWGSAILPRPWYEAERVYVSVCPLTYLKNHVAKHHNFLYLLLLWRRFDTLCTSDFVDNVIFLYYGPSKQQCQAQANAPATRYWLRPGLDQPNFGLQ